MAVLVTGGAGYIGSHTVLALRDSGREVVVVDNLRTGHIEALPRGIRFHRGDVRDGDFLASVFRDNHIDSAVHFAANSLVGESVALPLEYYDNNLNGARTLVECLLGHQVDKLVFSSTAAVYGEPERVPILETDRTEPTNPYGETKLAVEKMLKWAANAGALRQVSLRYFNAAGAHPGGGIGEAHHPETHLIPLILQVPLGLRERLDVYGDDYDTKDGTCVRDYIHVSDLAAAHVRALEYLDRGNPGDVFNLGNGAGFSVREVVQAAREATSHDIPIRTMPRRPGDPDRLIASSDKARRVLGFAPEYPTIKDIVASAWRWHRSHPRGFGK